MHAWVYLPIVLFAFSPSDAEVQTAREVLDAAGVDGGLVAHVGCGGGGLTMALAANDGFVVHGLDVDSASVDATRQRIREAGFEGRVTVIQWNEAGLPYADNLVNLLIVSSSAGQIADSEVQRVLCPGGVAMLESTAGGEESAAGSGWQRIAKPWPEEIDEWTHWLHGPDGNAVARDSVVGPPRRLQWMARPLWARLHDAPSTTTSMVSARGRVFYIGDEGPTGIYERVSDKWFLTARDAFNGALLWKRPLPDWGWRAWTANWHARNNQPFQIPKRLVAVGDTVYVTLGFNAPVTALDAATGEVVRTYEGTDRTDEILVLGDVLVLSKNQQAHQPAENLHDPIKKSISVVDAGTGETLWTTGSFSGLQAKTDSIEPVGRLEMAAGDGGVYFCDGQAVVAMDLETGKERWRVDRPGGARQPANFNTRMGELCVLVYNDGVVLFLQPEGTISFHSVPGTAYAYDAASGRLLWQRRYGGWVHNTQPNVFVIDGVVWLHEHIEGGVRSGKRMVLPPELQETADYAVLGLDLHTGEQLRRFQTREIFDVGHHHRCYRNKATERFLLTSRRGVEFTDTSTGQCDLNHWVRGDCQLGVMPCNGLLYSTPHPCSCYIDTKLNGYYCLAPKSGGQHARVEPTPGQAEKGWERGPAFGNVRPSRRGESTTSWSTFRADSRRSGSLAVDVRGDVAIGWKSGLKNRLGPLTIAEGLVFVPVTNQHRIVALDRETGREAWDYTTGGRVDVPPTVLSGLALFGSSDGWVYCLRVADGQLVWKRRIGPAQRLVGVDGQLESAWPILSGVLIQDDIAYVAAGRSSYLDGGITFCGLDPATGSIETQQTIYSADVETDKMPEGDAFTIPGTLADVLVGDGQAVWMRHQLVFGQEGRGILPVYATGGFRDDSWFNRTDWSVGSVPHAQLLVFDSHNAYGIEAFPSTGRAVAFRPADRGYRLFGRPLKAVPSAASEVRRGKGEGKKGGSGADLWSQRVNVRGKAMALAGQTLFVAGAPDVIDEEDPLGPLEGRHGSMVCAYDVGSGRERQQLRLDSLPAWDGMAVADGRVYLAMQSGEVICLQETAE